jgi:KUP system potassium uptake protein
MIPFLVVDLVFLGANLLKIVEGGWLPLAVGAALLVVMLTWRRGTSLLGEQSKKEDLLLADHLPRLEHKFSNRVPGTAVFLTSHPENVPTALLHNLKHNKILHSKNIVVCIDTADTPRLDEADRGKAKRISDTFTIVRLKFGFMEEPDVPRAIMRRRLGLNLNPMQTSFYLSRRALRPSARSQMPLWQDRLFIWLARHSSDASQYFKIPTDRVIEVGTQVVI